MRDGYVFSGWSDGTKVYDPGTAVTLTADTTFTAVWVAGNSYTASFTGIGAEGIELSYAWYCNGVLITGANGATYKVKNVADRGEYYCVVTVFIFK